MLDIDAKELKAIVKDIVIDLEEQVMVEGPTGIGKSEAIAQAIEEAGGVMVDIRLGQYDSVDMRGFPGVDKATGQTIWHSPSTMPFIGNNRFPDDKPVVIFFDEVTSATPPVFANCYQLANDWSLGEHVLKPNVRMIFAGNRVSDRGVVNRMPIPLCNRLTWYSMVPSVKAWCDWGTETGAIPPMFAAFMNYRKNLLHTYDPDKPERIIATPRTWMKAIKYYKSTIPDARKRGAMIGSVGEGPAMEFWGFHDLWHKVTPIETILKDPKGCPVPEDEGMRYATAVSVSGSMDDQTTTPLYAFLKRMDPEYVILAWQLALARDKNLFDHPEMIDFSKRYRVIFS